jgi:hypothetical protein
MWSRAAALVALLVIDQGGQSVQSGQDGQSATRVAIDLDPTVKAVLVHDLKFSSSELTDVARGKVVRHSLDAPAPGEVAAVGATWVNASADTFLNAFHDIVHFKQSEGVLQIGRFSDPPTIEDLAGLTVDEDDFDARHCRVGDCSTRLPAADIVRFQREIGWDAPDAKRRAFALYKEILLGHVRSYWAGGPGRIAQYDDGKRPIRPADEFVGILRNSTIVAALAPGLAEHLLDFPAARLEGAEDFLYWSKERFGIAPFITVTHVTVTRGLANTVVITSKDAYSSRYFDASLGMTVISEARGGGLFLIYVNRSRADALKGGLSGVRRAIVERRVRGSLDQNLKAIKNRLERDTVMKR